MSGIALQLYTMRDPAKKDLPGMLKRVHDMGWRYVQWSGMPELPAEDIRKYLDDAGLKCIAAHCGMEPFETDFGAQVRFWKTVGCKDVAPGGMMNDCSGSLEAWLRGAGRLDAIGARLAQEGMRLSYHNHDHEFEKFPGDDRCKLDVLYAATGFSHLYAELDLAWVFIGKADPAAYLLKYTGRCPVIHAKDCTGPRDEKNRAVFVPLGQGVLDWPAIFAAGKEAGVEWWVYEQDSVRGELWDEVQQSYEFLSKNIATE